MTAHTLPKFLSVTPAFEGSNTPGSIFLNRKSSFRTNGKEMFHYKFDNADSLDGYRSLPHIRRSTVNVTFNQIHNNVDPYVHALNWLPKFKDLCKGYLARKTVKELRKRNEAAKTIQKAAEYYLDPWVQIFQEIRPTFKLVKIEELKKYLRECILQIKKLNFERQFIEGQLNDVAEIMEQAWNNGNKCLKDEDAISPNMFEILSAFQMNINNDTYLKEYLDLDIGETATLQASFDESTYHNSKVHTVYDMAHKLQQKIQEDKTFWTTLQEKCQNLEKENLDLRNENAKLEQASRMLRGSVNKNEIHFQEQKDKVQDYITMLEKMNQEKKTFLNKIKEHEKLLLEKEESLVEINGKCEYYESELDRKTKSLETLNHEKTRYDKRIKELEEKLNISFDNQNELESTIELQKTRLTDIKKRLTEQLKTTEDEMMQTINESKEQLSEQHELIETQNEKIKQYEKAIWRLEHKIDDANHTDASDEEKDYERERKLDLQLKRANANIEIMKEEIKNMELNYEELQNRVKELQSNLEKANEETMEQKKSNERFKTQIATCKSALTENELKLNRANREKVNFENKWKKCKEMNQHFEDEITKLQEELTHSLNAMNAKNKEIENLNNEFADASKEYENRINILEKNIVEFQERFDDNTTLLVHRSEEWKTSHNIQEVKIEELQQSLEEKEAEIEQFELDKLDQLKLIKKLQRRVEEQDEFQIENQKTITKLRDELKSLQDENDVQWGSMSNSGLASPIELRTADFISREKTLSRSSSNMTTPSPNQNEKYFTLPVTRRSARK